MSERQVILIRETLAESIVSNAITFGTVAGLIGLGVWLESGAMQWFGALMAMFSIFARTTGRVRAATMSTSEARAFIDRIERGEKP